MTVHPPPGQPMTRTIVATRPPSAYCWQIVAPWRTCGILTGEYDVEESPVNDATIYGYYGA